MQPGPIASAPPAVVREVRGVDTLKPIDGGQGTDLMYRAILFRLGAAAIVFDGDDERSAVEVAAYEPIVQALGTRGPRWLPRQS